MKLHSFRQDLQDYFVLVWLYPVHPVDPVRKLYIYAVKFSSSIRPAFFWPAAGLNPESLDL